MNYTSVAYDFPNGIKLVVRDVIDRSGVIHSPDAEMIRNVIGNFQTAQKCLANDIDGVEDGEEYPTAEPIDSDEYRVQLFGKVAVKLATGTYRANVNMFNEYTNAIDTIELMREMLRGVWGAGLLRDNTNGNGKLAQTADDFRQHADDNGGAVDLAQQFPREGAPAGTNSTDTTTNSGEVYLPDFKNGDRKQYEAQYAGQTIVVDVAEIAHRWEENQGKTKNWFEWSFRPRFNGEPSKYYAGTLREFVPDEGSNKREWDIYKQLFQLAPTVGKSVTGNFKCKFKLNESNGRIYWNLVAIEGEHDDDFDALPEGVSEADMPF